MRHQEQQQRPTLHRTPTQKQIQTLNIQKLQKHVLALQNNLLKKQIQLYDWRQKTDFPIVKIQSYKIIDQRLEKTHIQVILNSCYHRFTDFKEIKLEDIVVYIKEAFVGFERLFNKFRLFDVKPEMIIIDHKGKCRVWVNSNFSLNLPEKEIKDFETFYRNIVNIFQQVTVKTPTSMSFYLSLKTVNCFIKGMKMIEDFIKNKKLKINPKPQIRKICSTPNLFIKFPRIAQIKQEVKNFRQTIGYTGKRQNLQHKQVSHQALTFSAKNSRPLQKRIQQMIQKTPKEEFIEKNSLVLQKFKYKNNETARPPERQLKKVFKNIKQFKFRRQKEEPKLQDRSDNDIEHKSQIFEKSMIQSKARAETTRHDCELNSQKNKTYSSKCAPQTLKNLQEGGRFSVTQTRSTSFFNNSNERFCSINDHEPVQARRFGNVKFSEITHYKNSEISDFNRQIENILNGIDGDKSPKSNDNKKQIFSEEVIQNHFDNSGHDYSNPNISILEHEDLKAETFKKNSRNQYRPPNQMDKYGQITDQIQEPTSEQISQKFIQLGWKNTLNQLTLENQNSNMKQSIHQNQATQLQSGNVLNKIEKKPIQLNKLDKIKNKQLAESVMNQDDFI